MIDESANPVPVAFLRAPADSEPVVVRVVRALSRHRIWLAVSTVGYLIFIITAHDLMQQPAYWAQSKLSSHRSWNNLVAAIAIPLCIAFCIWMITAILRHPRKGVASVYLVVTVVLTTLFYNTLLCMNIETIHFPQYALLAILLFAITGSYRETIIWAVLAGLLDEGFQYFVLYSDRRIYMDFNDVLLNTLGAGFGVVTLYAFGVTRESVNRGRTMIRPIWKSKAIITVCVLGVGAACLYATGRLRWLAASEPAGWSIALRRSEPVKAFWNHISWGKTFHEVNPIEWLATTALLVPFYMLLERFQTRTDPS